MNAPRISYQKCKQRKKATPSQKHK